MSYHSHSTGNGWCETNHRPVRDQYIARYDSQRGKNHDETQTYYKNNKKHKQIHFKKIVSTVKMRNVISLIQLNPDIRATSHQE